MFAFIQSLDKNYVLDLPFGRQALGEEFGCGIPCKTLTEGC